MPVVTRALQVQAVAAQGWGPGRPRQLLLVVALRLAHNKQVALGSGQDIHAVLAPSVRWEH